MIQYLISALIDLAIGIYAVRKRPNAATSALLFVALCSASWSFELFLLTYLGNTATLNTWFHIFRVGMFFIPSSMALLAWRIIDDSSVVFFRLVVMPSLGASFCLAIANLFFLPSILEPAIQGFLPQVDIIYYLYASLFIGTMVALIVFGTSRFCFVTERKKLRIKWLLITMTMTLLSGCISLFLMTYDFYLSKLVSVAGKTLFIAMLFYSTVQYNLMDVRLALSVGGARLLLLPFFCWLYFSVISSIADSFDSVGSTITLTIFCITVLESYPRILQWLLVNTKKVFSINKFELEEAVKVCRQRLSCCVGLVDLQEILDYVFCDVAKIEMYQVFMARDMARDSSEGSNKELVELFSGKKLGEICPKNLLACRDLGASNMIFSDELSEPAKHIFQATDGKAFLCIMSEKNLEAVVALGCPTASAHYEYNDIRLFEWLASELAQPLKRIQAIEVFENELHEAKKRLSLLSMMNHYHHDIKAPLSIIDGVVTHRLYDGEKQRQVILEQVALGSKLITTMAAILKGKRQRQVGPVALQPALNDCLLIFRQMLAGATVNVSEDTHVVGDADDLKILFINLIKNAVEAAQPGSKIRLTVTAWCQNDGVIVSIRDDGVGMAPEVLGRLWELSSSTKPNGSGIGLQAIKRIADEHQAAIDVASRQGEGTTFTLRFPPAGQLGELADTA
jgi:hypothetical protein